MADQPRDTSRPRYQIRVKGHLNLVWSDWFDSFEISWGENETLLMGSVIDQSALYGLLMKIHNLGLTLLGVKRLDNPNKDDPKDDPNSAQPEERT